LQFSYLRVTSKWKCQTETFTYLKCCIDEWQTKCRFWQKNKWLLNGI
jgi:hypothetical protein